MATDNMGRSGGDATASDRVRRMLITHRPPAASDVKWLLDGGGLVTALQRQVAAGSTELADELHDSALRLRLDDEAIYLPQSGFLDRFDVVLAAARFAAVADGEPAASDFPVDLLAAVAGSFCASGSNVISAELVALLQSRGATVVRRVDVPMLISRHIDGRLANLRLSVVEGPPGIWPDLRASLFTRVDSAFRQSLTDAREAAGIEESVRWAVISTMTGRAHESVVGSSAGLAAALGMRALDGSSPAVAFDTWAFTGAIDSAGTVLSLLDDSADLGAYRNKLLGAGRRTVVIPAVDASAVTELAEAIGYHGRLVAVDDLDGAAVQIASPQWWYRWSREPFVGRTAALTTLDAAWADAAVGPSILDVSGEAGMGKTRLAAEVGRRLSADGARVLYGRCAQDALGELQPFMEALGQLISASARDDLIAELGPRSADLARWIPHPSLQLPDAEMIQVSDSAHAFFLLVEAIHHWLRVVVSHGPIAIVLDDLQWADPLTLRLLQQVVSPARSLPVLVVLVRRDRDVGETIPTPDFLDRLGQGAAFRAVHLDGLDTDDIECLLRERIGSRPDDDLHDVAETLHRETGGHALFVTQLVTHLERSGVFDRQGALSTAIAGFELPNAVTSVIDRRIEQLSDAARTVLSVAAVAGETFGVGVIGDACGLDEDPRLDAIEEAMLGGFIGEVDGSPTRLTFNHMIIRRCVLRRVSNARRLHLHRDLARALERQMPRTSSVVAEMAFHFSEAAPIADAAKAVGYAVACADDEVSRHGHRAAAQSLRRALAAMEYLVDPDPAQRCELLVRLGEAANRSGDVDAGRVAFLEAAQLARTLQRSDLFTAAALSFGGPIQVATEDHEAVALLGEALARLPLEPSADRAIVLGCLAQRQYVSASRIEKLRLTDESVRIARSLDRPDVLGKVLLSRNWALYGADDADLRFAAGQEIAEIGARTGDRELELQGAQCCVHALVELGDIDALPIARQRRDRLAHELQQPHYLWIAAVHVALDEIVAGRLASATRLARHALSIEQTSDRHQALIVFGTQIHTIQWLQGSLGEQRGYIAALIERQPERTLWRCTQAWITAETGELSACADALAAAVRLGFERADRNFEWWSMVVGITYGSAAVGDPDLARMVVPLVEPFADRFCTTGQSANYGSVAHYLGVLNRTIGDVRAADQWFDRARTAHRRLDSPPLCALTDTAQAVMLASIDHERSSVMAERARTVASQVGMAAVLLQLDAAGL